jgi:hypothetical protein
MIKTWQQRCEEHPDHEGIVTEHMIRERMQEEIDELRQALEQPEQEPVAWMGVDSYGNVNKFRTNEFGGGIPLYTAPPKKEWVGLSDEDKDSFWRADQMTSEEWDELFAAVEAKLKEKNGG